MRIVQLSLAKVDNFSSQRNKSVLEKKYEGMIQVMFLLSEIKYVTICLFSAG